MHGLGNDFVVINGLDNSVPDISSHARKICDRRFGVGCDQLLVIRPSERADFKMEIFNNDGGQAEMCGNGIRCVAKYLMNHGATAKNEFSVETLAGIIRPRLVGNLIEVDMGQPILDGPDIPVEATGKVIDHPLEVSGKTFLVTCVSMGNPHCVIFVPDAAAVDVAHWGPLLENHPFFPQRANVEFVEVQDQANLKMRVWERGAGETLACGTGACAALVAAVLGGQSDREAKLHLKGGTLTVRWSEQNNHVSMVGPGEEVFSGVMEI